MGIGIVVRKYAGHLVLQDLGTLGGILHILLDAVHPPPDSIAAVESRLAAAVQKIRNESVSKGLTKSNDDEASLVVTASEEHGATQSDEGITAPAPHIAYING